MAVASVEVISGPQRDATGAEHPIALESMRPGGAIMQNAWSFTIPHLES